LASPLDLVALAVATFTGVWYGMLCPLGLGYFFRESGTPSIAQSLDVSSSSDLHRRGGGVVGDEVSPKGEVWTPERNEKNWQKGQNTQNTTEYKNYGSKKRFSSFRVFPV